MSLKPERQLSAGALARPVRFKDRVIIPLFSHLTPCRTPVYLEKVGLTFFA